MIAAFWREAAIWYLEWAQANIDPSHPDVPYIILRLSYWKDQR